MQLANLKSRAIDWSLWLLLAIILAFKAPAWMTLNSMEGTAAPITRVYSESGEEATLLKGNKKHIVVFWATWCKPCSLELSRLNSAVENGEIAADAVVAVSFGEDPGFVFEESRKRGYRFEVRADPDGKAAASYRVESTPTVFHIDEGGKIRHASSGVGPFTVYRARYFL